MGNFVIPVYVDYAGKLRKSRVTSEYYSATTRITLKRGDTTRFAVYFLDQTTNIAYTLAPGTIVQVAMKPKGKFDSSIGYTCYGSTSTNPTGEDTAYYIGVPLFGEELNTLLGVGGSSQNDPSYVDLLFEISWSEDAGITWNSSTDIVEARIYNDIIRSETDTPSLPAPAPEGLGLYPVYKETITFAEGGEGKVILNLRSLFDIKAGEVAHFKISSICTRRLNMAGDNPPPSAIYGGLNIDIAQSYAAVNLATTDDYEGLAAVSNVFDEYDGASNLGEVAMTLSSADSSITDDGVFKKAGTVILTFSHSNTSAYTHLELIGSVMVELIATYTL